MMLDVVILAAGEGTRMRSRLPKVLHSLAGKPLLGHVIDAASALDPARIHIVHGHRGEQVRAHFAGDALAWIEQAERLGTGHAMQQVMPAIPSEASVLVLYGDVPLIRPATLRRLLEQVEAHGLAIVTAALDDPDGYGRIVRDGNGRITRIVEEKDANDAERRISEVNTGMLAAHAALLSRCLERLDNRNAQGEFYLTDVIALAAAEGVTPGSTVPEDVNEILGVNTRAQLASLERAWQAREAGLLMQNGATLMDPARLDIRGDVLSGIDVTIDVNVVLEGCVEIGDNVTIGPNCVIRDTRIGAGSRIEANCVIDHADIGPDCRIGPFARIRPEAALDAGVHIGNFVEIKKASIGRGSKINHLSYIGDATVGRLVNIGAGTITCNYDGANKHRTEIGDGAFIGSDTQLVAPVRVGAGATIGAGSTITRDAPDDRLTLSRAPQQTRKGWKRPVKKETGSE
jgi:bifunctional UDP-N-acetylglucosamine pyrophosphorylase / glucosamine-1-phosphate N-acetyltransferase